MDYKEYFQLDKSFTYLNHGSFGACLKPVFEKYQQWQRKLEDQPFYFFQKLLIPELTKVRSVLADYIHCAVDELVLVPNVTFAVNAVIRSLDLKAGDEILSTNHEYGACNNAWKFICQEKGAKYIRIPFDLPLPEDQQIIDSLFSGVTKNTRVIFLSHISSKTAHRFPVEKICKKARELDILTVIDGAHTVGQIDLDMNNLGADFYFSNAHKWLCTPKGSAFYYAAKNVQPLVKPLITGWGWGDERELLVGNDFVDFNQWLGTNDVTAYLTIPDAIEFFKQNNWISVRNRCHSLLSSAIKQVCAITQKQTLYRTENLYAQFGIAPLPDQVNVLELKQFLFEQKIEIPVYEWNNYKFMRISIQAYNTQQDVDRLCSVLSEYLDYKML